MLLNNKTVLHSILALGLTATMFSCKKVDTPDPMGGAGTTIVKLPSDGGYNLTFVELKPTPQTIKLADVRRDIPNESELNKTMKVVVREVPDLVTAYNAENDTEFEILPADAYVANAANPKSGTDYTVTLTPGQFSNWIKLDIPDGTKLDPNLTYALGLTVYSIDQSGKISEPLKSCVVQVGVKNKYDGHYKVTGSMTDFTNSALVGAYSSTMEVDLETVDANTVLWYSTTPFNGYGHAILNGTQVSYYGNFTPEIQFNDTKVVSVVNGYGQGAGNRFGVLDPTGINTFDPATREINIKYSMNQPSISTVRTLFTEKLTFLRDR